MRPPTKFTAKPPEDETTGGLKLQRQLA